MVQFASSGLSESLLSYVQMQIPVWLQLLPRIVHHFQAEPAVPVAADTSTGRPQHHSVDLQPSAPPLSNGPVGGLRYVSRGCKCLHTASLFVRWPECPCSHLRRSPDPSGFAGKRHRARRQRSCLVVGGPRGRPGISRQGRQVVERKSSRRCAGDRQ